MDASCTDIKRYKLCVPECLEGLFAKARSKHSIKRIFCSSDTFLDLDQLELKLPCLKNETGTIDQHSRVGVSQLQYGDLPAEDGDQT